ncbi:hypothetical protein K439DRAFT_1610152 [Ramaria rubella]|nr:hypothetical protein K439DRAFT_1610152 [Ramaria rubella]
MATTMRILIRVQTLKSKLNLVMMTQVSQRLIMGFLLAIIITYDPNAGTINAPKLNAMSQCMQLGRTCGDATPTSPKDAMPAAPPTHVRSATAVSQTFFEVTVVDIKVEFQRIVQHLDEHANVALIWVGLLGCSPLELYHQIRCRQSSFSLQAMAKVLCALHNVTYFNVFRQQLSIAFDVYLDIQRHVQCAVDNALGCNTVSWRLHHACLPCGYKLQDEPKLIPDRLQSMDGNNSLKHVNCAGHANSRIFESDYFILSAEVDRFKDDVRTRSGAVYSQAATAACRHGLMQTLVEMRCSGELAKYDLATLDQIVDTFGDDQAVGYDIACSHITTVAASSITHKARVHRLILAVNTFHGHAHNLRCQLSNHPIYLCGIGIEDLETCGHVFSSSNAVACIVRYALHFHWQQSIHLHYQQWDEDKQALAIIREYTPEVEAYKARFGLKDEDFVKWHDEQVEYLNNLKDEPQEDMFQIQCNEMLRFRDRAVYGGTTSVQFLDYVPANFSSNGSLSQASQAHTRAKEHECWVAHSKLLLAMNVANDLEQQLGLSKRWTPEDEAYQRAAVYLKHCHFIWVVEELERLVVQRLFELSKANLMETGYKMRKHIGQAIAHRSAAVHAAVDKYNTLAPLQMPPCPILEYSAVAAYSWLGEFDLLKESCYEVLQRPWAVPANCEVATKYYKIVRAHEELQHLNVKARRLHIWVVDEGVHLNTVITQLHDTDPILAAAIQAKALVWQRVNNVHCARLRVLYKLPGYTGHITPAVKLGGVAMLDSDGHSDTEVVDGQAVVASELQGDEEVEVNDNDLLRDEALRYTDIIDSQLFTSM